MKPVNPYNLGECYELWTGLFQSTVLGKQPYLNVDIAHKAFPIAMSILDVIKVLCNTNDLSKPLDNWNIEKITDHLKGLRITYNMPGAASSKKCYKFNKMGVSAAQHKFKCDAQATQMTVADYFLKERKYKITFPNLPCVVVGNEIRSVYLPAELCEISANQAVMKKCTENQTRAMIKESATSTDERKRKIMEMLGKINHNRSATLNQFGVSVGNEFASIPARILDTPRLEYAENKTANVSRGAWNAAGSFLNPASIDNWYILCLDRRTQDRNLQDFARKVSTNFFFFIWDEKVYGFSCIYTFDIHKFLFHLA